ncbi:nucleotidyltransferase domain-containing protein [Candidatus Woesearchaeota archaeon]|nr:nucleotidyltransferase domain-containing protein [Candidatus Woesearchaeota archaeon]
MEQLVKTVQGIGNGAHIVVPKEMIGRRVMVLSVLKSEREITQEMLTLLGANLKHVMGIYLYGSYARNEQAPESDVDILVVSTRKLKLPKKYLTYEITVATLEQLEKQLEDNAPLILPIILEAKPLMNESLLDRYKEHTLTRKNTQWYMETTETSLALARGLIDEKEYLPSIIYPLLLRLRGLFLIKTLLRGKLPAAEHVHRYLVKGGLSQEKVEQLMLLYRQHRDDKRISSHSLNHKDALLLYGIVHRYYAGVKKLWEKLK